MKFHNSKLAKLLHLSSKLLYLCLIVSLASLIIYLFENDYPDNILFLILTVLQYSSLMLCISSIYKIIMNVYHFSRRPSFPRFMKILLYFFYIAYGLFMVFLKSFIVTIAGGI